MGSVIKKGVIIAYTDSEGQDQPVHLRNLIRSLSGRFENHLLDSFVLRFYGPVNPMGSCGARSVYLTTRLLGRLSPLSG